MREDRSISILLEVMQSQIKKEGTDLPALTAGLLLFEVIIRNKMLKQGL